MEIFGIPVIFIVIIALLAISDYYEKEKKRNEKNAQIWNAIHTGMSKDAVRRRLGEPHRAWQAGKAEIWGYGPKDSDGLIRFINGEVVAYQQPD
jgi:outer membrane protein assembly factor BamE (lipoprotein component of BamABCDE complex)